MRVSGARIPVPYRRREELDEAPAAGDVTVRSHHWWLSRLRLTFREAPLLLVPSAWVEVARPPRCSACTTFASYRAASDSHIRRRRIARERLGVSSRAEPDRFHEGYRQVAGPRGDRAVA
jgi:hypothetical protein